MRLMRTSCVFLPSCLESVLINQYAGTGAARGRAAGGAARAADFEAAIAAAHEELDARGEADPHAAAEGHRDRAAPVHG